MVDLNDRKLADLKEYDDYFPYCPFEVRLKLLDFDELQSDTRAGWFALFEVTDVKKTGEDNPNYQPLPDVGKQYQIAMPAKIAPEVWIKDAAGKTLRLLLAALSGVEHSPSFDANAALKTITKLKQAEKLDALDEIVMKRTAKVGKEKPEGGRYVNTKDSFGVAA